MDELDPVAAFIAERTSRATPKRLRKIKAAVVTAATPQRRGSAYSHTKTGYRSDLGITVRSGWEANLLRVLKSYDIPYEFEPNIFYFPIKRGNRSYCPDIWLPRTQEWIEVKGYFDKDSQIKMKRFKKYYPDEFAALTMVISKSSKLGRNFCTLLGVPTILYYEDLSKNFKDKLPNWEGR